VLITFPDETRNKMLGGRKTLLGTMSNVDGRRAQFTWNGSKHGINADQARTLFFKDSDLALKFQVKMIKKSFFELTGKVSDTEKVDDGGVRVTVAFTRIADADQQALDRFAEDMSFLKRQLPGS
jgi:hypothetical protein